MIQKKFRQHRNQKKMREMLESKEKDKYYEYKFKIEQIRHLTKQNIKLSQQTDKAKDIQIINLDEDQNYNGQKTHSKSNTGSKERKMLRSATINNVKNRPKTSVSTNDYEQNDQVKRSEQFNNRDSEQTPNRQQIRPKTAFSSTKSYGANTTKSGQGRGPMSFTHSTHYTSIFNIDDSSNNFEFKRGTEQLATKPIEQQLRNVKLIEAARNNRFWAVNTGKYIFCKRDFYLARDKIGQTALHWAVHHKNTEFIQWLLDQGSDPNAPDCNGNTPVHVAFRADKMEVIMMIINAGGDLNNLNIKGETPIAFGTLSMIKMLNLSNGTVVIGQHTAETNFDNNKLLRFFTQEDFNQLRIASYTNRFSGKKSNKFNDSLHIKDDNQKLIESKSLRKSESLAQIAC